MTISTRSVSYLDGETPLTGELHWNTPQQGKRPGILLVHGGAGLDDHAKYQARRYPLGRLRRLRLDMFGNGIAGTVIT